MTRRAPRVAGTLLAHRRPAVLVGLVTLLVSVLTACTSSSSPDLPTGPYSKRPNIVYVLTDDLDSSLVQYMPHVLALMQSGMSFSNYIVSDSQCCPSRSSIFTGNYPHDTHVQTNDPPFGGFGAFWQRGEEEHTFATALQSAGYRTALIGKYLNGYPVGNNPYGYPADHIPPGWSDWQAVSNGYGEYNYDMNSNGDLHTYGHSPQDYLTTVAQGLGRDFIRDSAEARKPFFLEVATFSPHTPFIPAPEDKGTFSSMKVPHDSSFNRIPAHAPPWLADRPKLSKAEIEDLDKKYILRVEDVQSLDRMIGNLELALQRTGQLSNTYFVFNSDNGLHIGQHGLEAGKLTAFDTDIKVPLVVAGPGIQPGSTSPQMTQNVDLAPTFEQLAGATASAPQDGHSLVPLLHGENVPWRSVALVEHTGPIDDPNDPDAQSFSAGNPPTYVAIRTQKYTYVRYDTGAREYYDLVNDPLENDNAIGTLSLARVGKLDRIMNALHTCHGGTQCWRAGRPLSNVTP